MCLRSQIKRKHKLHVNFGTGLRLHGIHILNLFKSDVFFFFFFFFLAHFGFSGKARCARVKVRKAHCTSEGSRVLCAQDALYRLSR